MSGDIIKSRALLNGMIYVVNKAVFQVVGPSSRSISRLSAKYVVEYLHSQNIVDKNNLSEESLKKAFIEDLGLCDDLIYSENDGLAVLEVINPVLRESVLELNKENIPITVAPCIIYAYVINDIRNCKASFEKVEYDEENNNTTWTFKVRC
ncbi:hypothetical protein [Methanococcus aeolicus]|nr:hypothetical protein [Methanococcus aeolicus]UXM84426.1 hypothetical protein N6C89_06710 [Methanococcus aeolicus]